MLERLVGNRPHYRARIAVILSHAAQMEPGCVLVIGDSITERIRFETLAGMPALNAGIGRATCKQWLPDAKSVIDAVKPSVVVLALGTNDKGRWHDDYRKLARLADFAVEPADPARAAFVRSVIRSVPGPTSLVGLHPDATGARQWIAAVEQELRHSLSIRVKSREAMR